MKNDKSNVIRIIGIVIFVALIVAVTIFMIPIIKILPSEEGRLKLKEQVESFGFFGPVVFLAIQVIQIIVAFIPGEPIEIIGGMLFGGFGGFFLCLGGVLIGTVSVFYLVKWIGQPLVSIFVNSEKINKYKIFSDKKRLETLVFILFLIPGTPKDVLTYIVPLTKIKSSKYFAYSTVARIPSIISSTFVGASIGKGNWLLSIIIFALTALIGLVGILYNDKLVTSIKSKKKNNVK